jgi:hypothetical protein
MEAIYNKNGNVVGWYQFGELYNHAGKNIGFVRFNAVFDIRSEYVGAVKNSQFLDKLGGTVAFLKNALMLNKKPELQEGPEKPENVTPMNHDLPHFVPMLPLLLHEWSESRWEEFLNIYEHEHE